MLNNRHNTLEDAFELAKKQTQLSINCVKIGTIVSFNPSTQRAEIQVSYKQIKEVLQDGTKVYQEYPLLKDCPVMVLFGGVDVLTMPIKAGDNCLVLFNDADMDQWASNGNGFPCTTSRMHDLSDAIAIVGIRPLSNVIGNYLANGIRLSHGVGNAQIDLKDNLIESVAALFLHNGDMEVTGNVHVNGNITVNGTITAVGNISGNGISLDSHTHGGVETGSGNTGVPQ